MPQKRNRLIELFIGNLSNAITHEILVKAIKNKNKEIAFYYQKEIENAINISKKYREKINPINAPISEKDVSYIKTKIIKKVNAELKIRILKGYKNINLALVDELVDKVLKEIKIN
ncbi:MAG: hypothetical protein AABX44_00215 [Nanoarchaeota archaeon]